MANTGDVVQIDPDVATFGGCLAVVDKVKSNGSVRAYVTIPGEDDPDVAYVNLADGEYEVVGEARWRLGESGESH